MSCDLFFWIPYLITCFWFCQAVLKTLNSYWWAIYKWWTDHWCMYIYKNIYSTLTRSGLPSSGPESEERMTGALRVAPPRVRGPLAPLTPRAVPRPRTTGPLTLGVVWPRPTVGTCWERLFTFYIMEYGKLPVVIIESMPLYLFYIMEYGKLAVAFSLTLR